MANLHISLEWIDPNTNKTHQYKGKLPVTIGRVDGNTIVLKSNRVSRNHARLEQSGGQVVLADLGSSNGTHVGNKYIQQGTAVLEDHSEFTIDPFVFLLTLVETEEPIPEPEYNESDATLAFRLPPPLNILSDKEAIVIEGHSHRVSFDAGEYLFRQGDDGTGCYLIDSGLVRIELDHEVADPDDNEVLTFIEPNTVLGEMSLLDRLPARPAPSPIRMSRPASSAWRPSTF